jgi:hypothetical protein
MKTAPFQAPNARVQRSLLSDGHTQHSLVFSCPVLSKIAAMDLLELCCSRKGALKEQYFGARSYCVSHARSKARDC